MLYCYTYTICYTYMTQVMGMAATENYYSAIGSLPYYGPPGVGLNAGVIMMNLTRMERMAGDGFTGAVRSGNTSREFLQILFLSYREVYKESHQRRKKSVENSKLRSRPPPLVSAFICISGQIGPFYTHFTHSKCEIFQFFYFEPFPIE